MAWKDRRGFVSEEKMGKILGCGQEVIRMETGRKS